MKASSVNLRLSHSRIDVNKAHVKLSTSINHPQQRTNNRSLYSYDILQYDKKPLESAVDVCFLDELRLRFPDALLSHLPDQLYNQFDWTKVSKLVKNLCSA